MTEKHPPAAHSDAKPLDDAAPNLDADPAIERDDYDVFLETWEPGERLLHATLAHNISDPLIHKRLLEDGTGTEPVARAPFVRGYKVMEEDEQQVRAYSFFETRQEKWAAEFRDYVLDRNVSEQKFNIYATAFANAWVDGKKLRQDSPEMMAVKASIRDYDRVCHPGLADRFVINGVDDGVSPLFTPEEMAAIFQANNGLIEALLPDYLDHLGGSGPRSLDEIYVRRGVYMPTIDIVRRELHYLSSYSLALGPTEQFANTWNKHTQGKGIPSIFSAPLAAVQHRVVAFAPFIPGMDLRQLEFVVAPPTEWMRLHDHGVHGNIREFSFR